jgi:hypothetical protein
MHGNTHPEVVAKEATMRGGWKAAGMVGGYVQVVRGMVVRSRGEAMWAVGAK